MGVYRIWAPMKVPRTTNTRSIFAQVLCSLLSLVSEDTMGGGGERGGRKTSRMTPLPKTGVIGPPAYGTFSSRRGSEKGSQKAFLERCSEGVLRRRFPEGAQNTFSESTHYHSFQNYYTHEIITFKLFRGLQLQLSGVFRIN